MMRLSSALTVVLLLMVACGDHAPKEPAAPTPTGSAGTPVSSAGFLSSHWSSIAIITLDFQTLQLKNAYVTYQKPCGNQNHPVSDDELRWRAGGIFDATGEFWSGQVDEETIGRREVLRFDVSHVGDFVVLEIAPSDFGGVAVSHPCSGLVLFAGSIVWNGQGEQLYPAVPLPPDRLQRTSDQAPPPDRIDVVGTYVTDEEGGLAAWNSVRDLNLVKDLAVPPYSVVVYLYPRTVGMFDPDAADWVIFVHHGRTKW